MTAGQAGAHTRYVDCLQRRDAAAALQVAMSLLDSGAGVDGVLAMLADAQHEVGDRWARNEWTIADEHAATAITDRVAAVIAASVVEPAVHQPVTVVCVEGEWHTLPARTLADRLRARRWDVRFLGGSIPGRDLHLHLAGERPLALAISASIPMFLPGALETVMAAHAQGIPVIAGGRAFGEDPLRAVAVGADGWAADPAEADEVLHRWAAEGCGPLTEPDPARVDAYSSLRGDRAQVVQHAGRSLEGHLPYLKEATPTQRQRTHEDLEYTLAFVEAAVLTGDDRIVAEYFPWLAGILAARHVPVSVLPPSVQALGDALRAFGREEAAEILSRGATAIAEAPPG